MPRSRLFLRIFGWFWVALAGMLATLMLMLYFFDAEMVSTRWNPMAGNQLLRPYADEATRIYAREGRAGLANYLDGLRKSAPGRVYLFDSKGTELAGQDPSSRIRGMASELKDPAKLDVRLSVRHGLVGAALFGPDSKPYAIVVELDRRPSVIPVFGFASLSAAGVALVVLALLCLLIARQLAAPVLKVSMATRQLAEGDLSARALDSGMAKRNDEFAELARDFDKMAVRIQTLVQVQQRLLWDISHELRSPLTRLGLALGIARRKAGPDASPMLDRIERETEQLNRMLQQLLTIARIKGGAAPPLNESIDLAALVSEVASDADFEARGVNRSVMCSAVPCHVSGSADLLKSAIENVVRNAIRHTAEGTAVEIGLTADTLRAMAVISIRDHGPGVPDAAVDRLFETFYRVPGQSEAGGAGLGLAITQQALAVHAGWVEARNAEGGGLLIQLGLRTISPADSFTASQETLSARLADV
ncbi:MAG TPA: ATP-binding protein [Bryobacteraceae bacterium]|jgi:two-component system sensor histidine kinase CpxA|nr:ATP-binding protein [Bryobacteraceae bacterium]